MTLFDELFGPGAKPKRVSLKDWKDVLHPVQKGKCRYCGHKLRQGDGHVDHKMPLSRGGKETPKNMQLLCGPCNTRKGALSDGEFKKRFKSVLPTILPPEKPVLLAKFEAVAKEVSVKKAKVAARRRKENDPWGFF